MDNIDRCILKILEQQHASSESTNSERREFGCVDLVSSSTITHSVCYETELRKEGESLFGWCGGFVFFGV